MWWIYNTNALACKTPNDDADDVYKVVLLSGPVSMSIEWLTESTKQTGILQLWKHQTFTMLF